MEIIRQNAPSLFPDLETANHFPLPPEDSLGWEKAAAQLKEKTYERGPLARELRDYNLSIGCDKETLSNIDKLKSPDSLCVFTGQQVGFMGGPTYTILKAITCLMVAKEKNAVPVFWLASEDHDVDEIDHAYLLDGYGNLQKHVLSLPKNGTFVEELEVTEAHLPVIEGFLETVGQKDLFDEIKGERSYAKMMARVLCRLFWGTGLVFLEPYLLRPFAKEFFLREIQQSETFRNALQITDHEGNASRKETNLFVKEAGRYRKKINRSGDTFYAGKSAYSESQFCALIEKSPELISTNAYARVLLQSLLFPVAAVVVGPGEMAYYRRLPDYFKAHNAPFPWIVPRISATLIPPFAHEWLENCKKMPWEPLPQHWNALFPQIAKEIPDFSKEWKDSARRFFSEDFSSDVLERKVNHYIENFEKKLVQKRIKKEGLPPYALHYLNNLLHPRNALQERVINWFQFQRYSGKNLILELMKPIDWKAPGHNYCFL